MVSGKLPPGKFSPGKFPPIELPRGNFPPGKSPPRNFPPGIFPPIFLNIPTRVTHSQMILSLKLLMRKVMLQNLINLMVPPEFAPVNCPLSSAFVNIFQNLSFESLLSKMSLLSKVSKQCFVFGHF